MAGSNHAGRWEKRWHPLRREWVIYSAHRNNRPWDGETEQTAVTNPASYEPSCYLCPGNTRVGGATNPDYDGVYVFDNDHPVVGPDAPDAREPAAAARGLARVVCYHPRHDITVGDLSEAQVLDVLKTWRQQTAELGARPDILTVQIFENKGEACGTSSPHPHCQIYATDFVMAHPTRTLDTLANDRDTFRKLLDFEQQDPRRIVAGQPHATAFVPYFARFPFEVWIFPKQRAAHLTELDDDALAGLASLYREINQRYDALFGMPFPYVMALAQAPTDGVLHPDFHLHLKFFPPLRAPGLRKILAGAELGGGNFMNDTIPEETAEQLRAVVIPNNAAATKEKHAEADKADMADKADKAPKEAT